VNRFVQKLASILGIAALLFAQVAVSAYACPMQFMQQDASVAMSGGYEETSDAPDADSSPLCQKHCEGGQQNVNDTVQAPIFVAVETGRVAPQSLATTALIEPTVSLSFLSHSTSPPLSIRNCCFRI
jgi:hypothetical protein